MNRKACLLLAGLALTSVGAATTAAPLNPEARLDRMLAGRVAGKPVDCINLRDVQSSEIIDRTAIVYRAGGVIYVNRAEGWQQALNDNSIMVTRTYNSQLCRVDIVQMLDRTTHFPMGSVGLGDFVPYYRANAHN